MKNIKNFPNIDVVILAGGKGSRIKKFLNRSCKPMIKFKNKPFIDYIIKKLSTYPINKIFILCGYKGIEIFKKYNNTTQNFVPIKCIIEKKPLGTGGALRLLKKKVTKNFIVINGDTFFEISLNELKLFKNKTQAEVVIALFKSNDRSRYGQVLLNEANQVKGFLKSNKDYSELSNGGVYLIDPIILNKNSYKFNVKCSLENDILPTLINQGSAVVGIEQGGKFLDIGIPADYNRAKKFLKN